MPVRKILTMSARLGILFSGVNRTLPELLEKPAKDPKRTKRLGSLCSAQSLWSAAWEFSAAAHADQQAYKTDHRIT